MSYTETRVSISEMEMMRSLGCTIFACLFLRILRVYQPNFSQSSPVHPNPSIYEYYLDNYLDRGNCCLGPVNVSIIPCFSPAMLKYLGDGADLLGTLVIYACLF